jgi:hypothetical protein
MRRLSSMEFGVKPAREVEELAKNTRLPLTQILEAYGLEQTVREVPKTVLDL